MVTESQGKIFQKRKKDAVRAAMMEVKASRIFVEEAAEGLKGVIGELVGAPDDPLPVVLAEGATVPVVLGPAEPVELLGESTLKNC